MSPLPVALDAMGGDHAPQAAVEAALMLRDAAEPLLLVGEPGPIEEELRARGESADAIAIHPAHEAIGMNELPVRAVRRKRRSSIAVGLELCARNEAAAFVSAGNTGAVVAASQLHLERLPGMRRPALTCPLPTPRGQFLLTDVGATLEPRPGDLVRFGAVAAVFAAALWSIERPRIGLLNVGSEDQKGHPLVRQAHELFRRSGLHYEGFVEGDDLFSDVADVVVCDAFVGNVVLKVLEGLGPTFVRFLRHSTRDHDPAGPLPALLKRIRAAEIGGAPLLGTREAVIVAHGRSGARALASAVGTARRFAELSLTRRLEEALERLEGRIGAC